MNALRKTNRVAQHNFEPKRYSFDNNSAHLSIKSYRKPKSKINIAKVTEISIQIFVIILLCVIIIYTTGNSSKNISDYQSIKADIDKNRVMAKDIENEVNAQINKVEADAKNKGMEEPKARQKLELSTNTLTQPEDNSLATAKKASEQNQR